MAELPSFRSGGLPVYLVDFCRTGTACLYIEKFKPISPQKAGLTVLQDSYRTGVGKKGWNVGREKIAVFRRTDNERTAVPGHQYPVGVVNRKNRHRVTAFNEFQGP